jgi:SOS response regulatory protein OraA/RecX
VGDIIDLDELPKKGFPAADGEAAIFPLKRSARDPSRGGGEVERFVIVGKTAMVTATAKSSSATGGPRKASITWWCHRCDIRAMTLNVEATGANLAHAHGRTPLLFETADVCLDFAQAFYRGSTAPGTAVRNDDDQEGTVSNAPKNPAKSDRRSTTNDASKDLTEDEELLLDRYRQYSQSDRTKLRLTCLSPQGEMQELEVVLSPTSESMKSVGSIEKDATAMYRKMLTSGLSADAVRHEMISEGVDTKIIAALLDKKNDESATSGFAAIRKDVGGGQLNLSPEKEKAASKYRKMLKMGIPPDAVRHKMTSDETCPTIIAAVLDEIIPNEAREKLVDEDEAIAAKYRNMINMGVPIDGVRHKMTMEGVNTKIINAVIAVSPKQQATIGTIQLSSEEDAIVEKYRTMLKMGVPLDGVKHKMDMEGVDLKIISALEQEASSSSATGDCSIASVNLPKKCTKSAGPILSKEEEAIAATYRNMLKVCIPKEAVRHKMKQEGVSDKIANAVLGKEVESGMGPDHASLANANSRKTIAFHWTTSNLAPELLEQSVFGRTELKKRKLLSINPEELDIKKLEELFQKKQNNVTTKKAAGQDENTSDMAKLLDLTRANNIAISLKAFNDFTFRSLAETINDIDPDFKIDCERVQFLPNLLPTAKELQAIKKYFGGDDKLISAELFFRQLLPIKRIDDKVKVMRAMSLFDEHVQETRTGFKTLQEVCGQIMNSDKLIQVLEMVLNIGNLMNAGTLNGGVEAFKFESLSKLSQTKSADGKTTILDYIVEAFITKGDRQSLLLLSEFPDIQVSIRRRHMIHSSLNNINSSPRVVKESCRLSISDLMNDVNTLRNDLKLCKNELTSMKRDQSSKRFTRSMSQKMSDENYAEDPKGALFAAIKSRGSEKTNPLPTHNDPRQALFAAIKSKKNADAAETDEESPSSDVLYSPGVHRLQKFLTHSKSILSIAEKDQDAAVRACKVR